MVELAVNLIYTAVYLQKGPRGNARSARRFVALNLLAVLASTYFQFIIIGSYSEPRLLYAQGDFYIYFVLSCTSANFCFVVIQLVQRLEWQYRMRAI